MTYCVGMLVDEGLVMLADTRTNAGVDNVSNYRKLRVIEHDRTRLIAIASAGSLSTTQAAMNALVGPVSVAEEPEPTRLADATSMFRVAQIVGQALRDAKAAVDSTIVDRSVYTDVTLLVGGSMGGAKPQLFLVYGKGNFIECAPDTPYLQVGEMKYGKPILDRLLTPTTPLAEAVKIGLLSMNSTVRSNLSVGPPIDVLVLKSRAAVPSELRIEEDDPYYVELGARWQAALREAQQAIPPPPYDLGR